MQAIEGCRLDGLHLMRILIKELRVMSRELIVPTYKIPALVRAPEGQVDLTERCVNRTDRLKTLVRAAAG